MEDMWDAGHLCKILLKNGEQFLPGPASETLVPVVLDMLAVQQAGGFASPMATYFCMHCNLKVQDIKNLDKHSWPPWDVVEHVKVGKQWHDAESLNEQNAIF